MARPRKDQVEAVQRAIARGKESETAPITADGLTYYDQFLCAVNRKGTVNSSGVMNGITLSVNIRELLREKVPIDSKVINSNGRTLVEELNRTNDHRNPHGNSHPMIKLYIPHGVAKPGETYKANDVYKMIETVDEETGDAKFIKSTKDIDGLKVHFDKKIVGYDNGKPVFENTKKVPAKRIEQEETEAA